MSVLEKTLSHLSGTLEQAEQGQSTSLPLDPRVKVIGALFITAAAVAATRLPVISALFLSLTLTALLMRITPARILTAWAGGLFFAAIVALPAAFTHGWKLALLLVLRSETSLTCWLIVIMTTPFNLVLRALRAIYVPTVFVAVVSMTFRYIFLLVRTAEDMLLSRRSRIVGKMNASETRHVISSTAGVLLGKSVQMSDEVYHAMISRGFRGEIHVLEDFEMHGKDWVTLVAVASVALAAFLLGR